MHRLHRSEAAISTVIGAILILALLVTVAAAVKLVYVPDLKKQAESGHMQEAIDDLYDFKAQAETIQAASTVGNGYATSIRVHLGGGEVPVLDPSRSSGSLLVDPAYGNFSVTAYYYNDTKVATRNASPLGRVVYEASNACYPDQRVEYEGGMLVLSQQPGQLMLASPPISVGRDPNDPARPLVTVNPIRINGSRQALGSNDVVTVRTGINPANNVLRAVNVTNVTITVRSDHADLWYAYFEQTMAASGLANNTNYLLTRPDPSTASLFIRGNGFGDDIGFTSIDSLMQTRLDAAPQQIQPLAPLPAVTPTPTPTPTATPTPTPTPAPNATITTAVTATQISATPGTSTDTYRVRVDVAVTDQSLTIPATNVFVAMNTITGLPSGQLNSVSLVSSPWPNPATIPATGTNTYSWSWDIVTKKNIKNVTFPVTVTGDNIATTTASTVYVPVPLPTPTPAPTYTNYTTAGTYTFTVPAGVTSLGVAVIGGGGGGGGGAYGSRMDYGGCGGGGGSGLVTTVTSVAVTPGQTFTVTVGAGGTGGARAWTGNANAGGAGTSSSFGATTAAGGKGGGGGAEGPDAGGTGLGGAGGAGYNAGGTGLNGPYVWPSGGGAGGAGYIGRGAGGAGGSNDPHNGLPGATGAILISYHPAGP